MSGRSRPDGKSLPEGERGVSVSERGVRTVFAYSLGTGTASSNAFGALCYYGTNDVSSKALGALDYSKRGDVSSKALGALDYSKRGDVSSKALGALAVAQRHILHSLRSFRIGVAEATEVNASAPRPFSPPGVDWFTERN